MRSQRGASRCDPAFLPPNLPLHSLQMFQGLRFPCFACALAAFPVYDSDFGQPFKALAHPAEAALLVAMRVVDPRGPAGRGKKILVNESIVIGEKHAETGMEWYQPTILWSGYWASLSRKYVPRCPA